LIVQLKKQQEKVLTCLKEKNEEIKSSNSNKSDAYYTAKTANVQSNTDDKAEICEKMERERELNTECEKFTVRALRLRSKAKELKARAQSIQSDAEASAI